MSLIAHPHRYGKPGGLAYPIPYVGFTCASV
jgi:hypothetical protein